jgi:hypothetical protein
MTPNSRNWLLPIFIALSLSLHAQKNFQPGYVILKNGDSLRGQIDNRDWSINPRSIHFRPDESQTRDYTTADLQGFGVGGDEYKSGTAKLYPYSTDVAVLTSEQYNPAPYEKTVFFRGLVKGRLNLYFYKDSTNVDYFFVGRADGGLQQLRLTSTVYERNGLEQYSLTEVYKNQLTALMNDCTPSARHITRTGYNETALRMLVFSYDHCGEDTAENRMANRNGRLHLYPVMGYFNNQVSIKSTAYDMSQVRFSSYGSVAAGAGLIYTQARNREQFSFGAELLFHHMSSQSPRFSENNFTSIDDRLDYNILDLNLLFRYTYPRGRVRPFIEMGLANSVVFSNTSTRSEYDNFDNSVVRSPFLQGAFQTYQPALLLGAGIRAARWNLEGRLAKSHGMSDREDVSSPTTTLYFLVSYWL